MIPPLGKDIPARLIKINYTKTCLKCKEIVESGKPDPCLGYLPGVAHACCGHAQPIQAFCCGFDGCKPDESITSHGRYRKGFWVKRGKEALEHMFNLKEKNADN